VDRTVAGVIVIVALAAVLVLLWFAWRRRTRRDAGIQPGYPLPGADAAPLASADAFYVATTRRDQPLERLNIRGLGFRARGHIAVQGDGVVLSLPGEEPRFIPATAIETIARATWAIDRVVESDGLLLVGWRAATTDAVGIGVDSYFRIVDTGDRERIIQALTRIAPVAAAGTTESEA
jgi:hypothetical protein